MKNFLIFVCFLCLLSSSSLLYAQKLKPFKQGDRVVFAGNSITCGGHYHAYIWLYYMTRFPDMRIDIFNEGIGGDTAGLIYERLDKVLEHEPTVLTLTFGMNDTGYMPPERQGADSVAMAHLKKAYEAYVLLEEACKKHTRSEKILIGGSPYEETARFGRGAPLIGKNKRIQQIGMLLEESARKNKWGFVDFNQPMVDINTREQQVDPGFTLCGRDRIHPTTDGHTVMAYFFLKAQGLAGKPVADILIDSQNKKIEKAENCRLSGLTIQPEQISFIYQANSLPFPVSEAAYENEKQTPADAMKVIPFMDEMNHEGLCIKGLSNGYHLLKINGEIIKRFTAQELGRGINMAGLKHTPQYKKALKIMELNEKRWLKERQMREFFWVEYNLMRKTSMLWACNDAAVDTLRKYAPNDIFLQWNGEYWLKFRNKGIREDCVNEQQQLINRIYSENKPDKLVFLIEKI
ncbi:MAG: SGNH/GDSL hydrolase family protein [Tannerellaceae bacterium]|nr:SGNH/GDSL hydrolase family protein [Tannerellaceae bacterium]